MEPRECLPDHAWCPSRWRNFGTTDDKTLTSAETDGAACALTGRPVMRDDTLRTRTV